MYEPFYCNKLKSIIVFIRMLNENALGFCTIYLKTVRFIPVKQTIAENLKNYIKNSQLGLSKIFFHTILSLSFSSI